MKSNNGITIIIVLLVVGLSVLLADGLNSQKFVPSVVATTTTGAVCCDSGNGKDCKTNSSKSFHFKGDEYQLLKSSISLKEGSGHCSKKGVSDDGKFTIFDNTTGETHANVAHHPDLVPTCGVDTDWYFDTRQQGQACFGIPNDEILFVSTTNSTSDICSGNFDVYYRIKDGPIPAPIADCKIIAASSGDKSQQKIIFDDKTPSKQNLQLKTFKVEATDINAAWLSPYCKPAMYLYPTRKTEVSVQIKSKEPFTLTIPQYPPNGWQVTAYPNGDILSGNAIFKYLYYETKIPDELINKEKTGYVIEYHKLSELFSTLLPKLGLNSSETADFTSYWEKALPKSNYYLVQVEPKTTLDTIASLSISPQPDHIIRVTLYFQPLDKKITMKEPTLSSVSRNGFTVVEWGGLYKKDKNHPFTCLM